MAQPEQAPNAHEIQVEGVHAPVGGQVGQGGANGADGAGVVRDLEQEECRPDDQQHVESQQQRLCMRIGEKLASRTEEHYSYEQGAQIAGSASPRGSPAESEH